MSRRYTYVRITLGSLLLITSGLKVYGLAISPIPFVGWFAQPNVQLATVAWEVTLGIWLLSGAYPLQSWLTAVGTFLAFAAVSGHIAWIGVASCNCFGAIKANPWWAFGLDITAIALLLMSRPRTELSNLDWSFRFIPEGVKWVSGAVLILSALTVAAIVAYDTPAIALARLRNEPVFTSPTHLDMGSGSPGTTLKSRVEITNWSTRAIRLVGGTSDCSCITHQDLPVSILPGESRWITIELRVPNSAPGKLTRQAALFTDHEWQQKVYLMVSCEVE